MKIENTLILSAGFGSRMGEMGKVLPKPLWPIFDHSMLYLQAIFLKDLGIKNIFINTFHHAEKIQEEVSNWGVRNINLIKEPILLGSGGAVHNYIKVRGADNGPLLTINSDAFYLFSKKALKDMELKLGKGDVVLLGRKVFSPNYNKLEISNGILKEIDRGHKRPKSFITYSGVGLINLKAIDYKGGVSQFWDSVANYKEKTVYVHEIDEDVEFRDFGTLYQYKENILELISNRKNDNSDFAKFLKRTHSFEEFDTTDGKNILGLKTNHKIKIEKGEFSIF